MTTRLRPWSPEEWSCLGSWADLGASCLRLLGNQRTGCPVPGILKIVSDNQQTSGWIKKKKATLCPERTADWDSSPEDAFKLPAGFWWQIIFRQDIRLERKWQIRFSRKVWLKSTENEDELDFGNKLRKTNPFNWKNSCMELRLISPYTYLYTSGLYTYGEPVEVFTDRGAKVGPGHCHQAWNGTTPLKNCWNKKVVERHICMYNIHI